VVQQIGKPQEVYDDPINLFVAKFLGTPPIHVFRANVQGETLFIGEEAVLPAKNVPDGPVWAAVRPEGFELEENGPLSCCLNRVEVMGRDISVVSTHPQCENTAIRAIVDADNLSAVGTAAAVRFALKPHKVFLFNMETEERIRF